MKKLIGLVCALAISGCFAPYEAIHGDELRNLQPLLPEIRSNVTVIQGTEDKLVKFGNLDFAEKQLTQAKFRAIPVQDMGHFVLWEDPELIAAEILALLDDSDL